MLERNHRWLNPSPLIEAEIFELYRTTRQFYDEAEYRQDVDRYCNWYRSMAEQHQRELQTMRRDINLFGWFCRRRS